MADALSGMTGSGAAPPGGSLLDLVSTQKGGVQNLGQFVAFITAPGQTLSSTTSPRATYYTALSTASLQVAAASSTRRAIEFWNSNPSGQNIWIVPAALSAVINRGILIVPGGRYQVPTTMAANSAFNAIAFTGSTNVLTVVEFF